MRVTRLGCPEQNKVFNSLRPDISLCLWTLFIQISCDLMVITFNSKRQVLDSTLHTCRCFVFKPIAYSFHLEKFYFARKDSLKLFTLAPIKLLVLVFLDGWYRRWRNGICEVVVLSVYTWSLNYQHLWLCTPVIIRCAKQPPSLHSHLILIR